MKRKKKGTDIGQIVKQLPSKMFLTNKGYKVPPMRKISIGTKLEIVSSKFVIIDGEKQKETVPMDSKDVELQKANDRIAELEKTLGAKGSAVKQDEQGKAIEALSAKVEKMTAPKQPKSLPKAGE